MLGRVFTILCLVSSPTFFSPQAIAEETQEFSCGTFMVGGGFYADAGYIRCTDGKKETENSIGGGRDSIDIFCSYNAHCTPSTPAFKEVIEKKLGKRWKEISDDEISKTMIEEYRGKQIETIPVQVQCMGRKVDGHPRCPSVNGCINNRQASVLWKIKAFRNIDPLLADPSDSEGFKMKKGTTTAPVGVVN